jgi:hypothetical protein
MSGSGKKRADGGAPSGRPAKRAAHGEGEEEVKVAEVASAVLPGLARIAPSYVPGTKPKIDGALLSTLVLDGKMQLDWMMSLPKIGDRSKIGREVENIALHLLTKPGASEEEERGRVLENVNVQMAISDPSSLPGLTFFHAMGRLLRVVVKHDPLNLGTVYSTLKLGIVVLKDGYSVSWIEGQLPPREHVLFAMFDEKSSLMFTLPRVTASMEVDLHPKCKSEEELMEIKAQNPAAYDAQMKCLTDLKIQVRLIPSPFHLDQQPVETCIVAVACLRLWDLIATTFWTAPEMECASVFVVDPKLVQQQLRPDVMAGIVAAISEVPLEDARGGHELVVVTGNRGPVAAARMSKYRMQRPVFRETAASHFNVQRRVRSGVVAALTEIGVTKYSEWFEELVELATRFPEHYSGQDVTNLGLALRTVLIGSVCNPTYTRGTTQYMKTTTERGKKIAQMVDDQVVARVEADKDAGIFYDAQDLVSSNTIALQMSHSVTAAVKSGKEAQYLANPRAANYEEMIGKHLRSDEFSNVAPGEDVVAYLDDYIMPLMRQQNAAYLAKVPDTKLVVWNGPTIMGLRKKLVTKVVKGEMKKVEIAVKTDITNRSSALVAGSEIIIKASMSPFANGRDDKAKRGVRVSFFEMLVIQVPNRGFRPLSKGEPSFDIVSCLEMGPFQEVGGCKSAYARLEDGGYEPDDDALLAAVKAVEGGVLCLEDAPAGAGGPSLAAAEELDE